MSYVAEIEVRIDGENITLRRLPFNMHDRALEVYFNLELPEGDHSLELKWMNPQEDKDMQISHCIVFSDQLIKIDDN